MNRRRYTPRLTWRPVVAVKSRSYTDIYGEVRLGWTLYLFGVLPIGQLRRAA